MDKDARGPAQAKFIVAYPFPRFDWSWLFRYFVQFSVEGSPHSIISVLCSDLKTAFAIKAGMPISESGKSKLLPSLRAQRTHTHNALDDAIEQAEVFRNLFCWEGLHGRTP